MVKFLTFPAWIHPRRTTNASVALVSKTCIALAGLAPLWYSCFTTIACGSVYMCVSEVLFSSCAGQRQSVCDTYNTEVKQMTYHVETKHRSHSTGLPPKVFLPLFQTLVAQIAALSLRNGCRRTEGNNMSTLGPSMYGVVTYIGVNWINVW